MRSPPEPGVALARLLADASDTTADGWLQLAASTSSPLLKLIALRALAGLEWPFALAHRGSDLELRLMEAAVDELYVALREPTIEVALREHWMSWLRSLQMELAHHYVEAGRRTQALRSDELDSVRARAREALGEH